MLILALLGFGLGQPHSSKLVGTLPTSPLIRPVALQEVTGSIEPPVPTEAPVDIIPADRQALMAAAGITDFIDTDYIITRESGWNLYAVNPSGACGLVQALPCGKVPWGDAVGQLRWFQNYCNSVYGGVAQARAFWEIHHAY